MNVPIQEQLALARRNQILDAAGKVFAEKGFHQATIRDIAAEAGIADGTMYLYFANKSALLPGIFERMRESIQQQTALEIPAEGEIHAVIKAILWQPMMAMRTDNFELIRVVLSEMLVNEELRTLYRREIMEPTLNLAEQYLAQLAEQGVIKPDRIDVVVRVLSGMVLGLAIQFMMNDEVLESAWDDLAYQLTDIVLNGIGSEQ